jgi:hypothetical protein
MLLPEEFAAMVPTATMRVGTRAGPVIAKTLSAAQLPVLFGLTEARRSARPPSVLCAGTPGSGKTMLLQYLMFLAVLQADASRRPATTLEVDAGDAEVAVAEWALDDDQRDALARQLDLVRREAPADAGRGGGPPEVRARRRGGSNGCPRVGPLTMQSSGPTGS